MMQLITECNREETELLSMQLEKVGSLSITLTDQFDDPILEPTRGSSPLWAHVVIHALFSEPDEAEFARVSLTALHPHLHISLQSLPEQDWERTCRDDFKPQQFGERLWICPSWLTPPDEQAVNIILDPGLAFGTGAHPTTSLCLTWLEQANLEKQSVIDYGCGSGILALAVLKLGAQTVHAIDIDEQALLATQNNAQTNHIPASQLSMGLPELPHPPVDLLIANILLTPLIALQLEFHTLLKHQGTLVVSGLLETQVATLIDAYLVHFVHHTTVIQGDWALLTFKPK